MKETNNKKLKKFSKEKGVTLVSLVVTIVIIIILATVTINTVLGENGLIEKAEKEKNRQEKEIITEEEDLNSMLTEYSNAMKEDSKIPNPPDITILSTDGTFSEEKGVNTPKISTNMELVKFDDNTGTWLVDKTNSSYSYIDTSVNGNENKSQWANARVTTQVGDETMESYFVWIPRYAYKITYYTDENKTTISETPTIYGTINIIFIKGTGKEGADGTICKYASENPTASDYIIHPAFTDDVDNGGWNSQIAGIWIGKYETARSDSEGATQGSATTLKVQPGVTSYRSESIGNMYTNALAYNTDLKSHMLKNSEWGAVAYLTESKYGRNGTEVTINNNGTTYYTGGGAEKAYVTNTPQSSTGNVYGIYDLSGNAYEYVAAGYQEQSSIGTTNGSNEYGTVYTGTSVSSEYKYGDAIYETSGWNSDGAGFVYLDHPFFLRGGYYGNYISSVGVFYYYHYSRYCF